MKLKIGKKSGLRYFNIENIRSWNPCYDPSRHLLETFKGTAVNILKNEYIPFQDRLWVVLRTEIVSEKVMRLFAVWAYRQTLVFIKNPDPRSIAAANVAEQFALGLASSDELHRAESSAESAAQSSARSAAQSAAWSAAESAAESAAWSAQSAARSAAWSAAESKAESKAEAAAWSAARSAAAAAQKDKLIEMIIADGKERKS